MGLSWSGANWDGDGDLFLYSLRDGEARQITHDDSVVSNPSSAPYGRALLESLTLTEPTVLPSATPETTHPGTGP